MCLDCCRVRSPAFNLHRSKVAIAKRQSLITASADQADTGIIQPGAEEQVAERLTRNLLLRQISWMRPPSMYYDMMKATST